ncbi:LLM class flavin-dependent oxidoreductase [Xinfangfangia sp. D13-10-4-6]|uniref:LLM class flavin-dependent oxidoreductase n=1 Tax=Pseudogemmobacter hezensis TaxID=2737662 RepID=UPI001556EF6A|nr:LLM class flavin-dependent oxidoreductase [Pseudogemmobacter hezensis]NPD16109.1 LLM class flavin-dependent oxidoreductase [Pseudogemmobacter hezensis]
MSNLDAFRAANNPMFNDNKLKLGIFGSNCSNACAITMAETSFEPTFEKNLEIARMLESSGFECMVPIARWRGFGGPSNFNGNCMETYTWAAALAAQTKSIYLFATSHVPTIHPIVAAKMATTIDHISKGRFGLNMVCGWFTPEMEMFGVKMMEHDTRYEYATEWIQAVEKLWTEEWSEMNGEFITIKNGFSDPKPFQKPRPVLISAGSSPKGREFGARFCDINFSVVENLDKGKAWVNDMRRLAYEQHRREIGAFTYSYAVVRDTEKEAKEYYDYYVHEKGDWEACDNVCRVFGIESGSYSKEYFDKFRANFIAGWGGYPLVGTPEQVTDKLIELSNTGIDGTLISMVDYNAELPYWNEKVMPLLEQAGLRKPMRQSAQAAA